MSHYQESLMWFLVFYCLMIGTFFRREVGRLTESFQLNPLIVLEQNVVLNRHRESLFH